MNREEEFLEKRFGRQASFKVPEGYFENFASEIMDKLPAREGRVIKMRPSLWRRYRPAMLIAASMIAAIFSVNILLHKSNASMPETSQSEQVHKSSSYSAIDQAADYTMLDNEEIYAYVTEDQGSH